jgi:integrase
MTDLRNIEGTSAVALEFLILTAARTSEVIYARWAELDPKNKIWIVPPERMKSTPMIRPTKQLLLSSPEVERIAGFVFVNSDHRWKQVRQRARGLRRRVRFNIE